MAQIFSAPDFIPEPVFSMDNWQAEDQKYRDAVIQWCKETGGTTDLVGQTVSFQIADGYAEYVVWKTKPLTLIHLRIGDAWSIPAAHARGLRVSDIREQADRAKRMAKLFAPVGPIQ